MSRPFWMVNIMEMLERLAYYGVRVVIPGGTVHFDPGVYPEWIIANRPMVLRTTSGPVVIGPYSVVLRADMEIRFNSSRFDSSSAIYRLNERKGQWVYYKSTLVGPALSTTARRPGVYGVFNDEHGPRIRKPFVRKHKSYATGIVLPAVVVPVEDTGSGVDHRRTSVSLDGIEQIAYWDSQDKKLFMVVRDPNIMGARAIQVVAFDQVGNRSQLDATVEIP